MRILMTLDTIFMDMVGTILLFGPNLTSESSYDDVASLPRYLSDWAVLIHFVTIVTKYNGPLGAAHAHIDDVRYDMVELGLLVGPNLTSESSYDIVASLPRYLSVWAVLIYFVTIVTKYNGLLEAVHAHIDDVRRCDMVGLILLESLSWISESSYDDVASLPRYLSVWAALIYFVTIGIKHNWPLEAAHAHIDVEIFDIVEWNAASLPKLDPSKQVSCWSVASNSAIHLGSAHIFTL